MSRKKSDDPFSRLLASMFRETLTELVERMVRSWPSVCHISVKPRSRRRISERPWTTTRSSRARRLERDPH